MLYGLFIFAVTAALMVNITVINPLAACPHPGARSNSTVSLSYIESASFSDNTFGVDTGKKVMKKNLKARFLLHSKRLISNTGLKFTQPGSMKWDTQAAPLLRFYSACVSGTLYYKYPDNGAGDILPKTQYILAEVIYLQTDKQQRLYLNPFDFVNGRINSSGNVNEYMQALSKYFAIAAENSHPLYKTLAAGVTDVNGNYSNCVTMPVVPGVYPAGNGLVFKDIVLNVPAAALGDLPNALQADPLYTSSGDSLVIRGSLYKVIRLIIQYPYLYSPAEDIFLKPGQVLRKVDLHGLVRTFNVVIPVDPSISDPGTTGIIYSKDGHQGIPKGNSHNTKKGKGITAEAVVNKNREIVFTGLARTVLPDPGARDIFYYKINCGKKKKTSCEEHHGSFFYGCDSLYVKQVLGSYDKFGKIFSDEAAIPVCTLSTFTSIQTVYSIKGQVLHSNKQGLPGATLLIRSKPAGSNKAWGDSSWYRCSENGQYEIHGLRPNHSFLLTAFSHGFIPEEKKLDTETLAGSKNLTIDFLLDSAYRISGSVMLPDSQGLAFFAGISGFAGNFYRPAFNICNGQPCYTPTTFTLLAEKNMIRLHIIPADDKYLSTDTVIVLKSKYTNLGNLLVYPATAKLKLTVYEINNKRDKVPLSGAEIKIAGLPGIFKTDDKGVLKTEFYPYRADNNYTLTINGPPGKNFEERSIVKNLQCDRSENIFELRLYKAVSVDGYVHMGLNPVKGAVIRLDDGNPDLHVSAVTDSNGYYQLQGLPRGKDLKLGVSKPGSLTIGQLYRLKAGDEDVYHVNFSVKAINDLDAGHLLGFESAIDSIYISDKEILLWGYLCHIPPNRFFSTQSAGQIIPFSGLAVSRDRQAGAEAVAVAYPKDGVIVSDLNHFNMIAFKSFPAIIENKTTGITIGETIIKVKNKTTVLPAAVKGLVLLKRNEIPSADVVFNTDVAVCMLDAKGLPEQLSRVFPNDPSSFASLAKPFRVFSSSFENLAFTLGGMQSTSNGTKSAVADDTVFLPVTLHTSFTNVEPGDINLYAGILQLPHKGNLYLKGNKPLKLKLQGWDLIAGNWYLVPSGFYLNAGKITTKEATIHFDFLKTVRDHLSSGAFDIPVLKLPAKKEVIPNKKAQNCFYYSDTIKAWILSIYPGGPAYSGTLQGLPGLDNDDRLNFSEIRCGSNKTILFSLYPHGEPIRIQDFFSFIPYRFTYSQNQLTLKGLVDAGILRAPAFIQCEINWSAKTENKLGFNLLPLVFSFDMYGPTAVFSQNSSQTLTSHGFTALGEVYKKNCISLMVNLTMIKNLTSISINGGQAYNFAPGKALVNISGGTTVDSGRWRPFTFKAETVSKSYQSFLSRLTVMVTSCMETVSLSQFAIRGFEESFKKVHLLFDTASKGFSGYANVDHETGFITISGLAGIRLDQFGWYLFTSGRVQYPWDTVNGFVLAGHYNLDLIPGASSYLKYLTGNSILPGSTNSQFNGIYTTAPFYVKITEISSASRLQGIINGDLFFNHASNLTLHTAFTPKTESFTYVFDYKAWAESVYCPDKGIKLNSSVQGRLEKKFTGSIRVSDRQWRINMDERLELKGNIQIFSSGIEFPLLLDVSSIYQPLKINLKTGWPEKTILQLK